MLTSVFEAIDKKLKMEVLCVFNTLKYQKTTFSTGKLSIISIFWIIN